MRIRVWFTLFFLPVFPYSVFYLVTCPVCGTGAVVKREKVNDLKSLVLQNSNSGVVTNFSIEDALKSSTPIRTRKIFLILGAVIVVLVIIFSAIPYFSAPNTDIRKAKSLYSQRDMDGAMSHIVAVKERFRSTYDRSPELRYLEGIILYTKHDYYTVGNMYYSLVKDTEFFASLSPLDQLFVVHIYTETDNAFQASLALNQIDSTKLNQQLLLEYYTESAKVYFGLKDYEKTIEFADKRIEASDDKTLGATTAYLIKALALNHLGGSYQESQKNFMKAMAGEIESPDNFFLVNYVQILAGSDFFEAEIIGNYHPEEKDPSFNATMYTEFAQFYVNKDDFKNAVLYLDKAEEQDAQYLPIYLVAAHVQTLQDKFKMAMVYYNRILSIDEHYYRGNNGIGWSLTELAQSGVFPESSYDEALQYLDKAIEYNPAYARPYNTIGYIHVMKNDFDKAIPYFEEALSHEDYEKPYGNLILTAQRMGDREKEEEYYNRLSDFKKREALKRSES